MKKIITVILSLIMVISLFACDSDGSKSTYKGEFFDGIITLNLNGDTVDATIQNSFVESGTNISLTVKMLGGKSDVSGDELSADFSKANYQLSLKVSGANEDSYIEALKSELLEAFENEKDKKLVNDLIDGKTISFGSDSPLKMLADGFVSLKAILISSKGKLLPTEIAYEEGSKWVYEYYDNGHMKSESHYNSDGSFDYKNDFENPDPDNGNENNSSSNNQKPDEGNNQGNNQNRPDDSSKEEEDDKQEDSEGGNLSGGGNVVIGGIGEMPIGDFYGNYEGKKATLYIQEDFTPVLVIFFEGEEGGVKIEQWFNITNGKILIGAKNTAIIDFGVDVIRYASKMTITGENAEKYMREVLDNVEASDMSEADKSLYRDLVLGREVYFGKEAELYNGVKLGTIKFTIDAQKGEFTAEDVQIAIGGGSSSGNGSISGGKDPNYSEKHPDIGVTDTIDPRPDDGKDDDNGNNGIYMLGAFRGEMMGFDAMIDFPENKQPVLTLFVNLVVGDVEIKQTVKVHNGKLIHHSRSTAVVDFTVDDIYYSMQMKFSGSGAAEYREAMEKDIMNSDMPTEDKMLYKRALTGKEITFGKESSLYDGMEISVIEFTLNDDLTFTYAALENTENDLTGVGLINENESDEDDYYVNFDENSATKTYENTDVYR